MQSCGFLGLGIMGAGMARNLLRAGFGVTVWNRTAAKCDPLVAEGAVRADSPAEVAASCPITFAILSDPTAAREVALGTGGVCEGLVEGHGYVDMSTVDPETSAAIGAAVAARGGRFLEAPVSGSKKPAEDGTLVILAAGDPSLNEEAGPAFDAMGKLTVFLGETGSGARMKLLVNMVMGGMMTAFCEGLALGQAAGLDGEQVLEVLDAGAIANPMFRIKGPTILAEQFAPHFPLKHMQKDLRLAIALGDTLGLPLPTAAAANESFKRARARGAADEDFSAVWRALD